MSRRRGRGEGSIYRRGSDGRWVGVIDLGWMNGQRQRKTVYGRTRGEVVEGMHRARRQLEDGVLVRDERLTVAAFLPMWLEACRPSVRESTWRRYEQYVRLHVVPFLGRVRLSKVTGQHLQRLYAARLAAGSSPQTVVHLHRALHRAFVQAVRWGLVGRNVVELVDPPRVPRRELHVLSVDEAVIFLRAARSSRLFALYVLALTTGMRQGELLGLRWREVELGHGRLAVVSALQVGSDGRRGLGETKTRQSRRGVLLTPLAVEVLRSHRVQQDRERLALGGAWEDLDLVFANQVGRPLSPQNLVQRDLYPLLEQAGVRRLRFHDLRHSAATFLLGAGVHAKIVSEMLGHTQTGITLDLYSHVSPTMQQAAVDALQALFGCQVGCQEVSAPASPQVSPRSSGDRATVS